MLENIIADLSCATGLLAVAVLILGIVAIAVSFQMGNIWILIGGIATVIFGVVCILVATGTITLDFWPTDWLSAPDTAEVTPVTPEPE